jgi:hypothetical protein
MSKWRARQCLDLNISFAKAIFQEYYKPAYQKLGDDNYYVFLIVFFGGAICTLLRIRYYYKENILLTVIIIVMQVACQVAHHIEGH